jgi:glutamyl-tRNA reductase
MRRARLAPGAPADHHRTHPMPLHILGLNHHSAPIEVREKLAFAPDQQPDAVRGIVALPGVDEAVLLSTCNRTEVYCQAGDARGVREWLVAEAGRAGLQIDAHLYVHSHGEAVRHAFRVAAGLDSMVLGEPQILGQVKQSVRVAEQQGTLGLTLNRLFQQTFSVAKRVRTETAIGTQSVSMSAAALKLAQNIFGDLASTSVLLIGVGEMVELAATYFTAQRPRSVVVANRTIARGEDFARRFGGTAISLKELPGRLHEFDIVLTGTASMLPILGKGLIESALKARRRRPMFFVDFAVPRDIEHEVATLEDIFLYTIDDLGVIVQEGAGVRRAAMIEAEAIVDAQVAAFQAWMGARAAVPAIVALRNRAEQYRKAELSRASQRLARGEEPAAVLEALAHGLMNKFLHHPQQALNSAGEAEREQLLQALERLYPLGGDPPDA